MESIGNIGLYLVFFGIVSAMLAIDFLGFKRKSEQPVALKQAAIWSAAWVSVAILFAAGLWCYLQQTVGISIANQKTLEYFSGYLLEKSLAIDNVFVWLMIFSAFAISPALQRKILLYGVLGAIVLRSIFILIGAWLVQEFSWILYLFGAFLVYTGWCLLTGKKQDHPDIEDLKLLQWLRRYLPITNNMHGDQFWIKAQGKFFFTPLFIVLLLVEGSDVIFAVDSIPAIFAVTTDPFIVLSANLMAILGLRAMFFLLAGAAEKLHYLPYGLGIILLFIGAKMLLLEVFHLPIWVSLGFIALVLGVTTLLSLRYRQQPAPLKD
jgi:tellurite resistance protein TerC